MKRKKVSLLIIIIIICCFVYLYHEISFRTNEVIYKQNNVFKKYNEVDLIKCIDGDTAEFSGIGKTRFLLIDTPESTNKIEPYGKKAAAYTCYQLKKAKVITYEYDGNKKDRYQRSLAWIFVDGDLLQSKIAQQGYVKKLYIYQDHYKYFYEVYEKINDKYKIYIKGEFDKYMDVQNAIHGGREKEQ